MKFAKFMYAIVSLFIVFSMSSCDNGEATAIEGNEVAIEGNNSRVRIKLVDAPGTYDNVFVNIVDVQYNSSEDEEGWKSFPEPEGGYPDQIDLCTLVAGDYYLLADVIIESEMLKQIRIVLGNNNEVVEDGENHDLTTPSAQQSGLKIKLDVELEPGFSYDFTLDWDVDKSIVKAGKSGKYILKPVIYASSEVNSGSISGIVVERLGESETMPVVGALIKVYNTNGTYFTSSTTDVSGSFILQGLKPEEINTFVLKITHPDYEEYNTPAGSEIIVEKGKVTTLTESIELLLPKSITGKVVGAIVADGDLVAQENVIVKLFVSTDLETLLAETSTIADGSFAFRGLPTENYTIKTMHTGYTEYVTENPPGIIVTSGLLTPLGDIEIELE